MSYVCLLEIHVHLPEGSDLKDKRKEIKSLKEQLQRRFHAAVAETDHHDLWQRATLTATVVARDAAGAQDGAAALERHVPGRFPDGASFRRALLSADEVLG